jgi:hypothetical protein
MRSITSAALSTGSARTMSTDAMKVIQTKRGIRFIVSPGARNVSVVAITLMALPTEPMPRTRMASAQ